MKIEFGPINGYTIIRWLLTCVLLFGVFKNTHWTVGVCLLLLAFEGELDNMIMRSILRQLLKGEVS